jgi:hypothetical protein
LFDGSFVFGILPIDTLFGIDYYQERKEGKGRKKNNAFRRGSEII